MKTERHFAEKENGRYAYHFSLDHTAWTQMDTTDDAISYGNWTNPFKRQILSYVEGDETLITCESDEEYRTELTRHVDWHKERGSWKGIYFMVSDNEKRARIERKFVDLGIDSFLYSCSDSKADKEDSSAPQTGI